MVVVVVLRFVPVDHALNGSEFFHMAGYSDRSFLIKPKFFFSLFQQLHEEWMVDVDHRDHKPLLLLPLTHHDCQTTFWDVVLLILILLMVVVVVMKVKVEVRYVQMKTHQMITAAKSHIVEKKTKKASRTFKYS